MPHVAIYGPLLTLSLPRDSLDLQSMGELKDDLLQIGCSIVDDPAFQIRICMSIAVIAVRTIFDVWHSFWQDMLGVFERGFSNSTLSFTSPSGHHSPPPQLQYARMAVLNIVGSLPNEMEKCGLGADDSYMVCNSLKSGFPAVLQMVQEVLKLSEAKEVPKLASMNRSGSAPPGLVRGGGNHLSSPFSDKSRSDHHMLMANSWSLKKCALEALLSWVSSSCLSVASSGGISLRSVISSKNEVIPLLFEAMKKPKLSREAGEVLLSLFTRRSLSDVAPGGNLNSSTSLSSAFTSASRLAQTSLQQEDASFVSGLISQLLGLVDVYREASAPFSSRIGGSVISEFEEENAKLCRSIVLLFVGFGESNVALLSQSLSFPPVRDFLEVLLEMTAHPVLDIAELGMQFWNALEYNICGNVEFVPYYEQLLRNTLSLCMFPRGEFGDSNSSGNNSSGGSGLLMTSEFDDVLLGAAEESEEMYHFGILRESAVQTLRACYAVIGDQFLSSIQELVAQACSSSPSSTPSSTLLSSTISSSTSTFAQSVPSYGDGGYDTQQWRLLELAYYALTAVNLHVPQTAPIVSLLFQLAFSLPIDLSQQTRTLPSTTSFVSASAAFSSSSSSSPSSTSTTISTSTTSPFFFAPSSSTMHSNSGNRGLSPSSSHMPSSPEHSPRNIPNIHINNNNINININNVNQLMMTMMDTVPTNSATSTASAPSAISLVADHYLVNASISNSASHAKNVSMNAMMQSAQQPISSHDLHFPPFLLVSIARFVGEFRFWIDQQEEPLSLLEPALMMSLQWTTAPNSELAFSASVAFKNLCLSSASHLAPHIFPLIEHYASHSSNIRSEDRVTLAAGLVFLVKHLDCCEDMIHAVQNIWNPSALRIKEMMETKFDASGFHRHVVVEEEEVVVSGGATMCAELDILATCFTLNALPVSNRVGGGCSSSNEPRIGGSALSRQKVIAYGSPVSTSAGSGEHPLVQAIQAQDSQILRLLAQLGALILDSSSTHASATSASSPTSTISQSSASIMEHLSIIYSNMLTACQEWFEPLLGEVAPLLLAWFTKCLLPCCLHPLSLAVAQFGTCPEHLYEFSNMILEVSQAVYQAGNEENAELLCAYFELCSNILGTNPDILVQSNGAEVLDALIQVCLQTVLIEDRSLTISALGVLDKLMFGAHTMEREAWKDFVTNTVEHFGGEMIDTLLKCAVNNAATHHKSLLLLSTVLHRLIQTYNDNARQSLSQILSREALPGNLAACTTEEREVVVDTFLSLRSALQFRQFIGDFIDVANRKADVGTLMIWKSNNQEADRFGNSGKLAFPTNV